MKILLLGEYSNVHHTLALGLRELGHEVVVASDGDHWKNYPRDVDLSRRSFSIFDSLCYLLKLAWTFRKFRGYDVVQIINPVFLDLKGERIWPYYKYLRKYNRSVFMGAFGMDYYYAKACLGCKIFRYSDFNMGNVIRRSPENDVWIKDWVKGSKGVLNRRIADDCNGIIAGLYEYYASYVPYFRDKMEYIPFPVRLSEMTSDFQKSTHDKVRFFIGVQRSRSAYKGTDIMLKALNRVHEEMPELCDVIKVESVPFEEYCRLMNGSDVILDQLYSYTPAMNALEAMARGLVVVGGGEPENYQILNETEIFPVVNVEPNEESVYNKLRDLVLRKGEIPRLSNESKLYIKRHHDYVNVARRYVDFWSSKL